MKDTTSESYLIARVFLHQANVNPLSIKIPKFERNNNTIPAAIEITQKNHVEDSYQLYPNPTNSGFSIAGARELSSIRIINTQGVTITEVSYNFGDSISTLNWKSGVYIVIITNFKGENHVKKLVVQH